MAFGAVFPLDGKTETVDAMGVSPWSFTAAISAKVHNQLKIT